MKLQCFLILSLFSYAVFASDVITCGDAMAVGGEAKAELHRAAQQRAQIAIEEFVEKKLVRPYVDVTGNKTTPESMASLVEVFWCETSSKPLHSAYYSFYSSNKYAFK